MVFESKLSAYSACELVRSRAVRAEGKIFMVKRDSTPTSIEAKRRTVRTSPGACGAPPAESDAIARGMGGAHHRDAAAHGDDQRRDLRGSDFGVRQSCG